MYFETLNGGQFSLTQLIIPNNSAILFHQSSTTVSLETDTFFDSGEVVHMVKGIPSIQGI